MKPESHLVQLMSVTIDGNPMMRWKRNDGQWIGPEFRFYRHAIEYAKDNCVISHDDRQEIERNVSIRYP